MPQKGQRIRGVRRHRDAMTILLKSERERQRRVQVVINKENVRHGSPLNRHSARREYRYPEPNDTPSTPLRTGSPVFPQHACHSLLPVGPRVADGVDEVRPHLLVCQPPQAHDQFQIPPGYAEPGAEGGKVWKRVSIPTVDGR